jgi:hypothetical protein
MTDSAPWITLPLLRLDRWQSRWIYAVVIGLWLAYLGLSLYAPISPGAQSLHISAMVLAWVKITVALFYLFVWLGGSYSVLTIESYTRSLTDGPDQQAFDYIKTGIFILISTLILAVLLGSIRSYLPNQASWNPAFVIVTNYLNVLPEVLAFLYFFIGIRLLSHQAQPEPLSLRSYFFYSLPLFLLAYLWLEIIFSNSTRMVATSPMTTATYYLPDSLLILTIVLPSILGWILGLAATTRLYNFHHKVNGTLYRQALSSLVFGFVSVVIASILFEALQALGSHRLLDFGLQKLLVMIYLFILVQGVGYFLMARGARRLHKIEIV